MKKIKIFTKGESKETFKTKILVYRFPTDPCSDDYNSQLEAGEIKEQEEENSDNVRQDGVG